MAYNLLITGVYWGYNPLTNHLLTSWDILVVINGVITTLKVALPFYNQGNPSYPPESYPHQERRPY